MSRLKKILGMEGPSDPRKKSLTFRENISALRILPRLFRMIWETNSRLTLLNVLLRIVKATLPLAQLYVGKLIIDEVVDLQRGDGNVDFLWTAVGIELGLALLSDILNRLIGLSDSLLGDLFANLTSVRLMDHAAKMDLSMFEDAQFYDKLERARRQTVGRVVLMSQMLMQVQDLLTIGFLIAGLAVVSPWLILLLAVAVIPAFLTEVYYNRSSYSLSRSWTPERRELDYLRYIGASDTTAKEVKIFGLSGFLTERFGKLAHRYYLANRNLSVRRTVWGSVFNAFGIGAYYAAYIYIIGDTIKGLLSIGDLTFLAGSFMRLRSLLQGMLSRFSSIAQSALYLQDLFDFLEIKADITSPEQAVPFPQPVQQGITFENVGFRYPGTERWAVRHLNFTLQAGEKMALVGENGAGKTTLVKLLARLYDPTEGRILLDGRDLREYDLKDLRDAIGVIFQDFVRFHLVAKENIGVGRVEELADRSRIEEAARKSLADTVVSKLDDGYDQMLGKRFNQGVELSGGEWQKVALARAYMRDAQILVLDEPTAALDARAEYEVFQRFSELTEGKSAVLISHRFSTVRMADRILVLKGGEMVEIGSHEELLRNKGLYAELFELQAQGYK
jgi:ATP-binding cassette subfamily B protein